MSSKELSLNSIKCPAKSLKCRAKLKRISRTLYTYSPEPCHTKTGLIIFAVVIPKDKNCLPPAEPRLFSMTKTIELYMGVYKDYILQSVSYQMKAWCQPSPLLVRHRQISLDLFYHDRAHTRYFNTINTKIEI